MQQRRITLKIFKFLAIGLVGFVFLFGFSGDAFAATCESELANWQREGNILCTLFYDDIEDAGLKTCSYEIKSNGLSTFTKSFTAGEGCLGEEPFEPEITISVGNGLYCRDNGENICDLTITGEDYAENTSFVVYEYDIDLEAPTTTISPDGSNWEYTAIPFTLSCSDTGSGCLIDSSYGVVNAQDTCTVGKLNKNNTSDEVSCSIEEEGCEKKVCYRSWDNSLHAEDVNTSNVFQIDKTAPMIGSFTINGKGYEETVITDSETSLAWEATDTGGSDIDFYEVWRALDTDGDGSPNWTSVPFAQVTSTSVSYDMPEGTAWYGIHAIDGAGNCITENIDIDKKGHCDGVTGDSLDFVRKTKGPIKVITKKDPKQINVPVDVTSPVLTMVTPVPSPTNDVTPNYTFHSTEAGSIAYGGDCSSTTIVAIAGNNTITFNPLIEGAHTNCTIQVTDGADNVSNELNVNDFIIAIDDSPPPSPDENQAPTIQSISSDLMVKANENVIFSANWSDPNPGERVKLFVCKGVLSGTFCDTQGSWCEGVLTTNNPAMCTYVTKVSDNGSNTYNAYVCDAQDACSTAEQGSFNVDAVAPAIFAFNVNPKKSDGLWVSSASPSVTISWHVIDSGSGLREVQVWRSSNGGVTWQQVPDSPFAAPSSDWNSSVTDSSTASGTYLYGIHVVDVVGNEITQTEAGFSAIEVQVDKDRPISAIQSPAVGTFHKDNFVVNIADVDTGGSTLDTGACTYSVLYDDGTCGAGPCKSALSNTSRTCSTDTPSISTSAHCTFEGIDTCRILAKSQDMVGNSNVLSVAQNSIRDFSIDFTAPKVDRLSCSGNLDVPCLQVQQGVATTFRDRVSDNLQLSDCNFLWRESGGSWQSMTAPSFTSIACQGGHIGDCLEASTPHTFSSLESYDIRGACWDSAGHYIEGIFDTILPESLSAILNTAPVAGSTNTRFDLSTQVVGTATGDINIKFDCENDAIWEYERDDVDFSISDPGWVTRQGDTVKTKVTAPDTFTVKDICNYPIQSIYTANTLVQRGISSAQDTALIDIQTNDSPQAINLKDNNSTVDYCSALSPPITLSWTFSDPDSGDTQSAYQVQIATNSGFGAGALVVDTGKVLSVNNEYAPSNLLFDTTYYWRVMVWDALGDASSFAEGSVFTTQIHASPFSDFTWAPLFPLPDEEIQFQDTTIFTLGSFGQSWLWSFGDGATSNLQNPTHTYTQSSPYLVGLRATDDAGSCGAQGDIDGDGIPNGEDDDIDGDGIANGDDPDIDGDGIANGQDSTPNGQIGFGGGGQGAGGSGESIVNVTLPIPEWQEISPF